MRTLGFCLVLFAALPARADLFDNLTNPDLAKAVASDAAQPVTEATANQLAAAAGVIPGNNATLLIVHSREGRYAKLLVQGGLQKIGAAKYPMLLIERFATFNAAEEQATVAKGGAIQLYAGLQFNVDLGQIVPPEVGGDLELKPAAGTGKFTLRPTAGAKLFLVKKKPALAATKPGKFVMGETFEPRYFNGSYKLFSDGRRSGTLKLDVDEASGVVTGSFVSDKGGHKYDVIGKLGAVRHQIQFAIKFPQSEEQFVGFLFTGDGRAIAGESKLRDREAGFYATRLEE